MKRLNPITKTVSILLSFVMMMGLFTATAYAAPKSDKATRTIMMYVCGADLETSAGMATFNLNQILGASFSRGDNVRYVIMTGGSKQWHTESSKLYDPATGESLDGISAEYNQIWEAYGANEENEAYRGKMVLVDGDGVSGDGDMAKTSENELMTDPQTLKEFIDYSVANYPAEQYDLILWDHGGGPTGGFGSDQHKPGKMSFEGILDALSDNAVMNTVGKFDFIDFDACIMGSTEIALVLSDYMDYYIASPETEPGYGQDYTGWLNALGEDPDANAYVLGKIIVDDFTAFYEKGYDDGTRQEGTLAVIDVDKLLDSGFVDALTQLSGVLHNENTSRRQFYDELNAAAGSIGYGTTTYFIDLGNLVSMLGIAYYESTGESYTNAYSEITQDILNILGDPSVIYAKGTSGIVSAEEHFYLNADGKPAYSTLGTSGLYIYFPPIDKPEGVKDYITEIETVLERLPVNDPLTEFLSGYLNTVTEYALTELSGKGISALLDEGTAKDNINYEWLKAYWSRPMYEGADPATHTMWIQNVSVMIDSLGGEAAVKLWLDPVIRQQADEAVDKTNVTVYSVDVPTGEEKQIRIDNTQKRVIAGVQENVIAELPIAKQFIESDKLFTPLRSDLHNHPEYANIAILTLLKNTMKNRPEYFAMEIGTFEGEQGDLGKSYGDYQEWLTDPLSVWNIHHEDNKWYAVTDAQGGVHVAEIDRNGDQLMVIAAYNTAGDDGAYDKLAGLCFDADNRLVSLYLMDDNGDFNNIKPSELKGEIKVTPVHLLNFALFFSCLPISDPFVLTAENFDSFSLAYTDIANIPDIQDTDGDGEPLTYKTTIRDIYGYQTDISEQMAEPVGELISIDYAEVQPSLYTGEPQRPMVTVKGKTLTEGVDYKVIDTEEFIDSGEYTILLEGLGDYTDSAFKKYVIFNGILGDADGNGKVTIEDATMIQKYLAEFDMPDSFVLKACDTNGDGKVTISDVTAIQRYLAEMDAPEGIGKPIA